MAIVTTRDLIRFMNIEGLVPDPNSRPGSNRISETVGTGDDTTVTFFLNNSFIITSSYTLYQGTAESNKTELIETTDYTLNKDYGKVTLTSAGLTKVSTRDLFADYSFVNISLSDTQLSNAIDRAQAEVEKRTYNKFTDGGTTTPDYSQVTKEKHTGKGKYDRGYYLENYPLPNVITNLSSDMTTGSGTINVDDTDGFLSVGILGIGTEKISYTGKTSTKFTGLTRGLDEGTAVVHSTDDEIVPFVFEVSTTESGASPSFQMLNKDTEYDLDLESGKVHIYRDDIVLDLLTSSSPPRLIPNRFRATYIWGTETIPEDIKRVVLMIAAKDLMHTTARKALANGLEDFRPESINVDEAWIERTLASYNNFKFNNI